MLRVIGRLGLRSVVLTLIALSALNLIMLVAGGVFRVDDPTDLMAPPLLRQAAAAADLMDRLDPAARADAVTALTSPMLRFELRERFARPEGAVDPRPLYVPRIEAYRNRFDDRPVEVYARAPQAVRGVLRQWLGMRPRGRLNDEIVVLLQLEDGGALAVEAGAAFRRRVAVDTVAMISAVVGLVLVGLLLWASVSYARPLERLARDSERFADDLDAPPS